LQFVQLVRRQVIESVDAHGFHRNVFFFSARKAVMCPLERYPFTIILKHEVQSPKLEPLRVKIDPGSKTTGLAIVHDGSTQAIFAAELTHRGQAITHALGARRGVRRSRRQRHTKYRKPRFKNRCRLEGWLAPSLESRVCNIVTWVMRLKSVCPITDLSLELVKFDLQAMENAKISGVEFQQGTLAGYELREYLLEKWNRTCAYCGATGVLLQVEHIQSRAKGGSNRASNLCLACERCNLKKGVQDIVTFLAHKPDVLARILARARASLNDAAAVNAMRWAVYHRLRILGLLIECGTGGRTKFNRVSRGLEKAHLLDAACVGTSTPEHLDIRGIVPLLIKACGHGRRQLCLMDKHGFPRTKAKQKQFTHGFHTEDIVRAGVPSYFKNPGRHIGRMSAKANGAFTITTGTGTETDIGKNYCQTLQRADGYGYQLKGRRDFPPIT
jgi:5-methylcytosine-specific restriction endonuclease McrA